MNIENLKSLGKEWYDGNRIYFNLIELFPGLTVNYSDTGSINSAVLNGEPLDNEKGLEFMLSLVFGKVWYDTELDRFDYKLQGNRVFSEFEMGELLVNEIEKRAV